MKITSNFLKVNPPKKKLFKHKINFTGTDIKKTTNLNDEYPVKQIIDGSFIIDENTNTKILYGTTASDVIQNKHFFPNYTEIITSPNSTTEIVTPNTSYVLNEAGAILIKAGSDNININPKTGSLLIIEYESLPHWYTQMKPDNEHQDFFATLAQRNYEIYIRDKQQKCSDLQNPGEVKERDFDSCPRWTFNKLLNTGILENTPSGKFTWANFYNINNIQEDLWFKTGIYGDVKNDILEVWKRTTRSGYDLSGLKAEFDGITIYSFKDKKNQFTNGPTEWITNSTAWTPAGTFMPGVSMVNVNNEPCTSKSFKEIRPNELFHKHISPIEPSQKITETYIITEGSAIIGTIKDGETQYKEVEEGTLAIVPPGTTHGIIAIQGKYQHLCAQTPSSFHYGLKMKNIIRDFTENETISAISKLTKHL